MKEMPKENLLRLSSEYEAAKRTLELKKIIEEKREELEQNIQKLKKDIETDTFKFYNKQQRQESKPIAAGIEKSLKLLKDLKEARKELDAKLDAFELISHGVCSGIRERLIHAIIEVYPKSKTEYVSLSELFKENEVIAELTKQLANSIEKIYALLAEISQERNSVKRAGILRYLFGTNPNYVITKNLKKIAILTAESLDRLKALDQIQPRSYAWVALLCQCLDNLQNHSKGRWGWKKIDTNIVPELDRLKSVKDNIKDAHAECESNVRTLHAKIETWIKEHSR